MKFVAEKKNALKSPKTLFGLFFEDINHSLDGLLNANLVQNGWFDFSYFTYGEPVVRCQSDNTRFWELENASLSTDAISKNRPFSIETRGEATIKNLGFDGESEKRMTIEPGEFEGEFYYKSEGDVFVRVFLENEKKLAMVSSLNLKASKTFKKAEYSFSVKEGGKVKLVFKIEAKKANFVGFSLVKSDYFVGKNKYPYGKFRKSVVKSLDIGGSFLRFPGGCLVEGDVSTDYLYDWEKTIGEKFERVSKPSVWGYLQTNEIGFYEYLCLCEELNLLPVPVHHVGLVCQIRTEVQRHLGFIRLDPKSKEFKERVTSSVAHLIYFAKGDPESEDDEERTFAKRRVEMGHKKPFDLRFVALGNENWGREYFENFEECLKGIKNYKHAGEKTDLVKKFGITILSSTGVDINPQDSNPSWVYLNRTHDELIVDEHVYNTPTWFIDNYHRYDLYNKNFSKVFMGEYACHTAANGEGVLGGENNFEAALAESVFMLGMENNPEIVKLSCYAPLLNKVGSTNWVPDLIHFDGEKEIETPSLAVQKLFMRSHGEKVIKLGYKKNLSNAAKISFESKNGSLKLVSISDLKGEELKKDECKKENVVLNMSYKLGDELKIHFAGDGFKFSLFVDNGHLYFEKRVNSLRMTLEDLGELTLSENFRIKYTFDAIELYDEKGKLLKRKQIYLTNELVFASLSMSKDKVFVKAINISKTSETFDLSLDEKLNISKIYGVKCVLTEGQNGGVKEEEKKVFLENKLVDSLAPRSINLYVFKR